MSFGQPLALLALLALLPLAAVWWYARYRGARNATAYGGPPALRRGMSRGRGTLRALLLAASVVLVAIAIARPQWGAVEGAVQRRGIDVVIALDVSRSMLATDVRPSRAAAAAAGLDDMLAHLRGDRAGLVTFGGSAFARSPLTLDLDAVTFLVDRAQLEGTLVEPGTDFAKAIQASLSLLDVPDRADSQAIVLLSDGENLGQDLDAAIEAARDADVRIYTVAVGTDAGAPVPARTATARQSPSGDGGAVTRADRATLARIGEETHGGTREVQNIAGLAVEFARLQQSAFDEDSETIPVERFQWFLGAALALLMVQWTIPEGRRPTAPLTSGATARVSILAGSVLGALLLAGCGGTAAYQKVSAGNEAYAAGRYEDALAAYEAATELAPDHPAVRYNIGNTLSRLQRHEEATTASRDAARLADRLGETSTAARALYAAGNHAFTLNALADARDAYIEALLRDPDDTDAQHNLELVLNLIAPPGQQQPPPPSGGATATPGPNSGDPSATATAPGQPGEPGAAATPGPGQPGATGTPGPNATPGAPGQPGQPTEPGQGAGSLSELLDDLLAEGVSLDEALALLDRLRRESEAANLEPRAPAGGALPDR